MTQKPQKSFILYEDYMELFNYLTMEERGELITMIFEYTGFGKIREDVSTILKMAFSTIRLTLDRDRANYMERCRINAENGKKGGRPKKDQSVEKTERFFEKAKKAYNDNEDEDDNDNDNEYENGGEDENENESQRRDDGENDLAPRGMVPLSEKAPPPLTEKSWEILREKGVPASYVEQRLARATVFAKSQKKSVGEVLCEWWKTDKLGTPPNKKLAKPQAGLEQRSYDIDEFANAAIERSWAEMLGNG